MRVSRLIGRQHQETILRQKTILPHDRNARFSKISTDGFHTDLLEREFNSGKNATRVKTSRHLLFIVIIVIGGRGKNFLNHRRKEVVGRAIDDNESKAIGCYRYTSHVVERRCTPTSCKPGLTTSVNRTRSGYLSKRDNVNYRGD